MSTLVLNLVISGIPSIPEREHEADILAQEVLNLVISGIPSILSMKELIFKLLRVLNLVISGIPSIRGLEKGNCKFSNIYVLNLVISGIPSILSLEHDIYNYDFHCFKPCYKWNTFNT